MDNFREWLSDNLRYILLGIAVCLVVVIVVCVVRLVGGSSKDSNKTDAQAVEQVTEASQNTAAASTAPDASASLKKDDASILELVKKYYTAVAAKDTATLATIVSPWTDDMQSSILSNNMIESYDNISTYSKAGPSDGTYVVYAYYDGKIKDISTEAPSLALLYVVTNESGSLVVGDRNASTEVADFISKATAASDVQALKNDVNQKLLEAENSDPDLKAFLDSQSSGASGETEAATESDASSAGGASGETATTTAGVNIRRRRVRTRRSSRSHTPEQRSRSSSAAISGHTSILTIRERHMMGMCRHSIFSSGILVPRRQIRRLVPGQRQPRRQVRLPAQTAQELRQVETHQVELCKRAERPVRSESLKKRI